ncbi:hypothetical protein ACFE04_006758 [Oxalis oulophora]
MESSSSDTKDTVATIKSLRTQLETRIETQTNTQLDILASLQSQVPNIVSSLDLSLQLISSFNNKPFTPTPPLPSSKPALNPKPHQFKPDPKLSPSPLNNLHQQQQEEDVINNKIITNEEDDDDSNAQLPVVRAMVAVCLLQRVPFTPIDSSTVLRKLENDGNVSAAEKAAMRDLGGESGSIFAVELALKSMGEDHGGVELEEFVITGKSRIMVLSIDRTKLMKELPETAMYLQEQNKDLSSSKDNNNNNNNISISINQNQNQQPQQDLNVNVNVNVFGREMWDHHMMGMMGRGRGMMGRGGGMGMMQHGRPPLANVPGVGMVNIGIPPPGPKMKSEEDEMKDLEAILNKKSFMEMQKSKTGEELLDLIHRPTARETAIAARFKTKGGSQLREYCSSLTKEDCRRQAGSFIACEKVHFRRIIAPHTDVNLGDCSFLDTCRHMKTCKYVHYELDSIPDMPLAPAKPLKSKRAEYCSEVELGESQWINCDIRSFRMDILGQFGVIMADPPWDIHMELPYGTMADDEMRTLNVPALQTDGLIFLWVTGRAMELGRECLELWGYKRVEEIIWVKTNQLQRIIRTGRTGHWLNHSKEHCLVGIKGNPEVNRNIDTDVVVAEVRETSRKPDEMYPLLERISPRTRKLELFARMHNTHSGWISLGNQLPGVRLVDDGLRARFKAAYPEVEVQPASPPRASSAMEIDSNPAKAPEPMVVDNEPVN